MQEKSTVYHRQFAGLHKILYLKKWMSQNKKLVNGSYNCLLPRSIKWSWNCSIKNETQYCLYNSNWVITAYSSQSKAFILREYSYMCRVLPIPPWPDCDAPLLLPAWKSNINTDVVFHTRKFLKLCTKDLNFLLFLFM